VNCFSLKVPRGRLGETSWPVVSLKRSALSPTRLWLRNSYMTVPWYALVPLRVMALMPPPEKPPWRTS
jgi:hypothetical protein